MTSRRMFLLLGLVLLPGLALGEPERFRVLKPIQKVPDRAAFVHQLRAHGYRSKGGIDKSKTDHDDGRSKSFPHFSSSFSYGGQTFPYTMVGYPPSSGRSSTLRAVIIPLRMHFVYFEQDAVFDPGKAVHNIVKSPMFQDARFVNGVGQFGDMLQRTTFWNAMDPQRRWHVRMDRPRVAGTVDVLVEPDIGELFQLGDTPDTILGNIRFGAMDSIIHTILQFVDVQPDEVPIFVTYNVFADALGYHDAFTVGKDDGTDVLQTLIYTSWLEGDVVGDLLADVSTFNHELGEWLNDPYVNNVVPTWLYPPLNATCSFNNLLEVGDPQGNGPEYYLFPTVPIRSNGYTYHLQDLVMLPWFTGEVPSTAQNGWYDYPDTTQITTPFQPCVF
jgi:hypothetical protein